MSQQTIVNGIITDPSGNPYKNCSYSVSLVNNTGLGTLPLLSGSTFQTVFDGGSCDSTGSFSQPLFDNNQITPLGTQWKFSVCDITGKTCFTYTTPVCPTAGCITGLNINISASISAVAPTLAVAGSPNLNTNNIFTGTNTFNGITNLVGNSFAKNFENVLYADQFTTTATVSPPSTAPIVNIVTTGGTVGANQFACKITYQGASGGETTPTGTSNVFTTTGTTNQLQCTDINYPPPAGAKCYNVYWQTGGAGNFFLGHSCIAFNSGDVQTTTPATSGTQPPVSNTAIGILPTVQTAAGSPGAYVLPSNLSTTLGSQGAPSSGQTIIDYRDGTMFMQPVAGANIGLYVTNPNVSTTDTQLQAGIIGSLGNVNPMTEWNRGQPFYPYAGVLGVVNLPNPSTIIGAAGVMGLASTTSPDTGGGGAVGGYFQGNCLGNLSKCWGINPVIFTQPGISSDYWNVVEVDINSHDTSATTANGILITGASSLVPAASNAIGISSPDTGASGCSFGSCARWGTGVSIGTGAAGVAISIAPAASGNSQASMPINFINKDSGGIFRTSAIGSDASGNLVLTAFATVATNQGMFTNSFFSALNYGTKNNCLANSVSPAACGSAAAGAFVVPTTTTTYTVNTTLVTANSVIIITPRTYTGNLPSAPTCVVPAITAEPVVSAISAGTSFTIAIASTTGQTCWNYWIIN